MLGAQLLSLLAPGAAPAAALRRLRAGVAASEAEQPRWAQNWTRAAAPLMRRATPSRALRALRLAPLLLAGAAATAACYRASGVPGAI